MGAIQAERSRYGRKLDRDLQRPAFAPGTRPLRRPGPPHPPGSRGCQRTRPSTTRCARGAGAGERRAPLGPTRRCPGTRPPSSPTPRLALLAHQPGPRRHVATTTATSTTGINAATLQAGPSVATPTSAHPALPAGPSPRGMPSAGTRTVIDIRKRKRRSLEGCRCAGPAPSATGRPSVASRREDEPRQPGPLLGDRARLRFRLATQRGRGSRALREKRSGNSPPAPPPERPPQRPWPRRPLPASAHARTAGRHGRPPPPAPGARPLRPHARRHSQSRS
jgi:hypothetical protein